MKYFKELTVGTVSTHEPSETILEAPNGLKETCTLCAAVKLNQSSHMLAYAKTS